MTWECPECGFDNDDERDMCEECGALRPAGVAPAPSTPAAPVQDFAAPSGERPAPAVYPATSSMGGTPQVQQPASQRVYQSVPVPAPQPAPMPQPRPCHNRCPPHNRCLRPRRSPRPCRCRSLPPCPFRNPLRLPRQCRSPRRNPWRMLQLLLRFLRLRLPIQLWVSSCVLRV